MAICPSCAAEQSESSKFCSDCGAALNPELAATVTHGNGDSAIDHLSHSDSSHHGRFLPGTILADRYRIVSLLGKGGMGEVYRADDLKLGHTVALKFLFAGLADDPEHLNHLYREVRLTRQISHPNVCRVYDIGEVDGQHFLAMEYVDGENLATLLRRIGRLPPDKGIQIARQLCSGLAAAHDKGVLHRDLKPANVMLDERGQVRITDFGLAVQAERVTGEESRSGTPAYMAPEQLRGEEVTVRSDLFSLGLLLFEIFTGRMVFQAQSFAELVRLHEQSWSISPSSEVPDLAADVDQQIVRCLRKDPQARPSSAAAVLEALPGADPLAAALAAGETPSPEMVADAGDVGTISPRTGATLIAVMLLGVSGLVMLSPYELHRRVPLDRSPQELTYEARRIISKLGYTEPAAASHSHFYPDGAYLSYIRKNDESVDRWERLKAGQPAAVHFWYLQSPELLTPYAPGTVTPTNPPQTQPGMLSVRLDLKGRLIALRYTPDRTETDDADAADPDWAKLFEAAGLDPGKFTPVKPKWIPSSHADTRAAWTGVFPDSTDVPLRVEAASYRGRPVYFSMQGPWVQPPKRAGGVRKVSLRTYLTFALPILVLIGAGWLARHNWRRGRVDKRGAMRLAVVIFVLHMAAWVSVTHHVAWITWEMYLLRGGLGTAFYWAVSVWIAYLAIEPHVRRRWPWRIISLNRVLAGRFRDPLVGKHLLIGAALGSWTPTFLKLYQALPGWFGYPPYQESYVGALNDGFYFVVLAQILAIEETIMMVAVFLLVAIVFRKEWLALTVIVVFAMLYFGGRGSEYAWLEAIFVAMIVLAYVFVFLRFGILPVTVGLFFHWLGITTPITTDFSDWYAAGCVAVFVLMISLAAYGAVTSIDSDESDGSAILERQFS